MTRREFIDNARPLPCVIDGRAGTLEPVRFRSGAVGWRWVADVVEVVNGVSVKVTARVTLTAKGSAKWEEEAAVPLLWAGEGV